MSSETDKLAPRGENENDLMANEPKTKPRITAKEKKARERKKTLGAVVDRLIEGESLREICATKGMPNKSTILRWLDDDEDLATTMARARGMQADALDDDIQEVVNAVRKGTLEPHAGQVIIRAHQWRAGKMKPKKYGDRQTVNMNHKIENLDDLK